MLYQENRYVHNKLKTDYENVVLEVLHGREKKKKKKNPAEGQRRE